MQNYYPRKYMHLFPHTDNVHEVEDDLACALRSAHDKHIRFVILTQRIVRVLNLLTD